MICSLSVVDVTSNEMDTHFLWIEILLAVRFLLEQFAAAVTKQFMNRDLNVEGTRVPRIEQIKIVGMNEGT